MFNYNGPVFKNTSLVIPFVSLLILFAAISLYMARYKQVMYEGFQLMDERCKTIDPLVFQKQKVALYYLKVAMEDNPQTVQNTVEAYTGLVHQYITAVEPWMEKDEVFLNRGDVKLLIRPELYALSQAMFDKYQADLDENYLMVDYMKGSSPENRERLFSAAKKQAAMQKVVDEKMDTFTKAKSDIRNYFFEPFKETCKKEDNNFFQSPRSNPGKA